MEANNGNKKTLIMYHGMCARGRGIEKLIDAVAASDGLCGIVLGNGTEAVMASLNDYAKKKGVEDRVLFKPAVPIEELWQYVGAVDISFMMIEAVARSYYFALPNKFFESVQSLTPILASDFPEMKRLVNEYGIGLTADPEDPAAISACIEKLVNDSEFYRKCEENLQKAKRDLCWENEKQVLFRAYEKYCPGTKTYVKYMPLHFVELASRNKREMQAAGEYGYDVTCFSSDAGMKTGPEGCRMRYDGYRKFIPGMKRLTRYRLYIMNRIRVCLKTLFLKGDVFSCHDLKALRTAWLMTQLRIKKPLLIYDSHEFEMGRNAKRSHLQNLSVKWWEKFLMKRCAFSIMVNDSIADEVQKIHGLSDRPVVVRSTPQYWEIDEAVCARRRQELEQQLQQLQKVD